MFKVALYNDFSVFGCTAYTAFGFEKLAKIFQVIVGTNEAGNECYYLSTPVFTIELYP